MRKRSHKNTDKNRRLDPAIIVALIGLTGTIIAALLASPLLERWFAAGPTPVATLVQASNTTNSTQVPDNKRISLNQTVTGTLYGAEAGTWIFSDGPARVTMILNVSPFGSALIIVRDPSGVDRAYMDQQKSPGITQLVDFFIPTEDDYTILVRNAANEQVDYTLTVQDALTPPPP
jgi:hypothetical protein